MLKRVHGHRLVLNRNSHKNKHLQAAWNKYGSSRFSFKILLHCPINKLTFWEQQFADQHARQAGIYNHGPFVDCSTRGTRLSVETRQKMSEARRTSPRAMAQRLQLHEMQRGKPRSIETRLKISESHRGLGHSTETRHKLSRSLRVSSRAKTQRLRLHETLRGKKLSMKHRRKIKETLCKFHARRRAIREATCGVDDLSQGQSVPIKEVNLN